DPAHRRIRARIRGHQETIHGSCAAARAPAATGRWLRDIAPRSAGAPLATARLTARRRSWPPRASGPPRPARGAPVRTPSAPAESRARRRRRKPEDPPTGRLDGPDANPQSPDYKAPWTIVTCESDGA